MIKGLVFDFDGLILDTESSIYDSLQWLYSRYGQKLPIDLWSQCVGGSNVFDPVEYLKELTEVEEDSAELTALYEKRSAELTADLGPLPGVVDYLKEARSLGLRLGVASSSPSLWVEGHLTKLGLVEHFDSITTADDVLEVKPDPALYLLAVKRLGIRPEEAIAFEDSPNGALAAERAGLFCVIVPNSVTAQMTFGDHDLRLESLADMDLREVIAQIEKMKQWKIS